MRKFIAIVAGIAAVVGIAAFAPPASAQDIPPALDPTTMIGFAGTVAADQIARREFGTRIAQRRPTRAQSVRPVQFAYRPSAAVRKQVYARAIARAQKVSPTEAPKLREALLSGRVARETASYLGRYGMSATNVADTTALNLALSWLATRASAADPTRAQMIGLRNQVAATFAATPAFARASDAIKQDLSEANIIEAAFASNIANAAARDPRLAAMARPAVAKGVMALYGIKLLKLNLTPQGLR